MKTKAIKRCIDNGSDIRDALAAQVELADIEKDISWKEKALRLALSYLPARDGKRIPGDPDSDVQLMICNEIKAALGEQ